MYVTIINIDDYLGIESLRINDILYLQKDLDNIDSEAIKILTKTGATCGYLANSTDDVIRGTHSSGYVYNQIKEKQECKILYITKQEAIAELM